MKSWQTFVLGCTVGAAAFAGGMGLQRAMSTGHASFTEITVGRINIAEPDGTPRLIISSKSRFPGSFVQGKEIPRPDRNSAAGMLFINEDGTENGGFLQSGHIDAQGAADAGLSLTFDRFRQDQTFQLLQAEEQGSSYAGVIINDQPDHRTFSVSQLMELVKRAKTLPQAEQEALFKPYAERGDLGNQRAYLGTTAKGTSTLILRDPQGRPRIRLAVTAAGEPRIEMLDATGSVVRSLESPATTR
jgi:hypothetical protein